MGLTSDIQNMAGVVTVQIEGFFTERFINLCKINNVKIWEIRNLVKGVVRFNINIKDFKKLRPIAKKTKCKVIIKDKKGIYFTMFKYRKRKLLVVLSLLIVLSAIAFSTFVWKINVIGNEYISTEVIIEKLRQSGMYVGKSKFGLDKKQVINNLRVELQDLSWVGIEFDGTTVNIKVIEKTKLADKDMQQTSVGDIVADKAGIITRIVPENGTAMYKEGSYIEKGNILIEGTIYSKLLEPMGVPAKGIVKINSEYELKKEYNYDINEKEYTGKKLYTIGIGINSKENMLNYLNKSKKYDILKSSKKINIFGAEISFDLYECVEYVDKPVHREKEKLIEISNIDSESYLKDTLFPTLDTPLLVEKNVDVQEKNDGIIVTTSFIVNERIGEFIERNIPNDS